jgi:hypothetical protein
MGRDKSKVHRDDQSTSDILGEDEATDDNELELPPETPEDFLLVALKMSNLNEVVQILRNWYGREDIKNALNRIVHRDPVDQFTHICRHAVELYAKKHEIIPSTLMVELAGKNSRVDAARSERYKLKKAREYVGQDRNALFGARALAECWGATRPDGQTAVEHLRNLERKLNILSPVPTPEV